MATTSLFLLSVLFLLGSIEARKRPLSFKWKQCGVAEHVLVHELNIYPSPIEAPGKAWLNLNFTILKTFNESDIKITMYKELLLGSIFVPCVFHMGSCTYKNSCTIADQMERQNWGGISSSLVTQLKREFQDNQIYMYCPHRPQNVGLDNVKLTIPPNMFGQIWDGSYKVKIQTMDKDHKKEIFCLDVEFSIIS